MEESGETIRYLIAVSDVVSKSGVIFKDSVENKKLFKDEDLMQLLFAGVTKPEIMFPNLM